MEHPSIWRRLAARRGLWHSAGGLFAVGLVALLAFGKLFTTFVKWDDEGYFLLTFRDFLSGRPAYDAVYSFYGPYTFITAAFATAFNPAHVTHDWLRWVTWVLWLGIVVGLAAVVYRWAGCYLSTVTAVLLVGVRLTGLSKGIGHPQIWAIAGIALLVAIGGSWLAATDKIRRAFWAGLVTGVVLLIKINLGIYILFAYMIFVALLVPATKIRRTAIAGTFFLASAVPAVMLLSKTDRWAVRFYVFVYICSLAAVVLTAASANINRKGSPLTAMTWFASGIIVAGAVGVGTVLVAGTSPVALWKGLVVEPLILANSYLLPFEEAAREKSYLLCVFAIVCGLAASYVSFRIQPGIHRERAAAGIRIVAAVVLLLATWVDLRLALCGSLALMWLLVWNPPFEGTASVLNRTLFALLALTYSLQLFPMAGEQVHWASLLPAVGGTLLFADGLKQLREQGKGTGFHISLARLAGIGVAGVFFLAVWNGALFAYREWNHLPSLGLPGATTLHISQVEGDRLRATTDSLRKNCKTALYVPGLYSLALWSNVAPREQRQVNTWPFLEGSEALPREVRALPSGSCVLISEWGYTFFGQFAKVRPGPDALGSIQSTMKAITGSHDLTLYRK